MGAGASPAPIPAPSASQATDGEAVTDYLTVKSARIPPA